MKLFLSNQETKFEKHLFDLKSKPVLAYQKNELIEKTSFVVLETTRSLNELELDFFFDYFIFPDTIIHFLSQWKAENRSMKVGDTIVQQAYLPPTKIISQKIIFGVRINEIIDLPDKKGFSYETLEGHVEKGISTFTIEKMETQLIFKIHTLSKPGNILTKVIGPIFSIPYQTYCTQKALKNVKKIIEKQ